jgi:hypothetical protein
MALHIIKLVVGVETLDELSAWRQARAGQERDWRVHTRMTPKRADEVLDGGSIYRVIKGVIVARQTILAIETHGEGRAARCQMVVSPQLVRVAPTPRRPFQGWRYLKPEDAPPDLDAASGLDAMPADLAAELRALGAW